MTQYKTQATPVFQVRSASSAFFLQLFWKKTKGDNSSSLASKTGNLPFWETLLPQKPKIEQLVQTNRQHHRPAMARVTQACTRVTRRIGMRGYTAVPEDGHTCYGCVLHILLSIIILVAIKFKVIDLKFLGNFKLKI